MSGEPQRTVDEQTTTQTTDPTSETDANAPPTVGRTVPCDGYCESVVPVAETVDVVAGAVLGEWSDPKPHVGVTSADGARPEVERWCRACAKSQFGVDALPDQNRGVARSRGVSRYVTPRTVAAFLLGALGMLVVASVMVV